jgi:hypothetical protein
MIPHVSAWAVTCAFLLLAPIHAAGLTVFGSEAEFRAAAGSLAFESFEETAPGLTGSSRVLEGFILGFGEIPGPVEIFDDPAFAADGVQSAGGWRNVSFFAFTTRPSAFAFTIFDFGDAGPNTLSAVLSTLDGRRETVRLASADEPFSEFRFFGILSSFAFDAIDIRHDLASDFTTVDAISFGTVVPEPSGLVLMIVAGFVLSARTVRRYARHRRKS